MSAFESRIRRAYAETQSYPEILYKVWPLEDYPRAHNFPAGGGPPICAMTFGKALRKLGGVREGDKVWIPREKQP